METSKTELTVDLSQTLQPTKMESHNEAGNSPFPQQQHDISTSLSSEPALLHSMSDHLNRVSDVLPKQFTDILGSASVTTECSVSEATFSSSQDPLTPTSVLQQTYISEGYSPVISGQQLSLSSVSDLILPVPDPSPSSITKDQDSGPVPVEDHSASLQSLYSTVSHLHQMLMKNPQLFAKNPQYPTSSATSVDPGQKDLSGDTQLMTRYYTKTEHEQEHDHISQHVPLIQVPNVSHYKYSELGAEKMDIEPGKASAATTTQYDNHQLISAHSHDVVLSVTNASDDVITSDSGQHLADSLYDKESKISRPQSQISHTKINEEIHFNQDQLKQFYHSHSINTTDVRPPNSKLTYAEQTVVEKHLETQEPDIDQNLSKSSQAIQIKENVSPFESVLPDQVGSDCICNELAAEVSGLPKGHRHSRKNQGKGNASRVFICGGCSSKFSTICRLHSHLKDHASGGSYHFDHVSRTAFPKYDTFCSYSQTDLFDDTTEELKSQGSHDNQARKTPIEAERILQHTIVTRRSTRKHEELAKETKKNTTRSQNQNSRKRKQDHPKSTKPRIQLVPIVAKEKKLVKERKPKRRGRGKKVEQKSDLVQGMLPDKSVDECRSDQKKDVQKDVPDSVELSEVYIDTEIVDAKLDYLSKEDACVIIVNPEPAESISGDDSSAMSKPFKKRGRSRKTVTELTKASSPNETDKKIPVNNSKKIKQLTHPTDAEEEEKRGIDTVEAEAEDESVSGEEDSLCDLEEEAEDKAGTEAKAKRKKTGKLDEFKMCDECGLTVPRHKYVFHVRSHTGERPFVCEKCGKSFARSRFLTKHLVTHQDVKPWRCDLCDAQFCQKNEYNMHMRGHAGDRPHLCNVCEKRFLSKTSLHTHQANIHMGLTRFECDVCKRRFFKRSSLTVHQATHFEATLKCSFCDRKFRDKTGVKRHERIHTGVKKFKCHVCDHAFIQSTPYWTHMEKRHSMSKVKVKEMLKQIQESNRRSGIKMDINVLPANVDPQALAKTDDVGDSKKGVKDKSKDFESEDFVPPNALPKFQHLSIVHGESNIAPGDEVFGHSLDPEQSTAFLLRHYGIHTTSHSNGVMLAAASPIETTTVGSAINLTSSLPSLSGLPSMLQPTMVTPSNSLQLHGFIGINNLQQALDYTSSLPQTSSYTDISSDRVVTESQ